MSIELLGLTLGNETISLKEPSSMVITRAWDSPAWQLDITLPHEGPLDDLTKIQVKHGTDALFAGLPACTLTPAQLKPCRNGAPIPRRDLTAGRYRVYGPDGEFLMIGRWERGRLITEKSFFEVS